MAHLQARPCRHQRPLPADKPCAVVAFVWHSRPSRRTSLACCSQHNFRLYTKPDCPLCDGLKDKLQGLIDRAEFMPSFLTGATLEVRDISSNAAWQDAMHLSIPVLAVADADGEEVILPRPQPRITADRLQRHLQEALAAVGPEHQHS
eukprot:GHUV01009557.1.p1 GENE.GHUV01009557.1~~GHUV01009557.1.p1  ORF type:complete len:148 (+),score=40.88 GHUV01009557.1:322-765(+)